MPLELFLDFFERPEAARRRVWAGRTFGSALAAYAVAGTSLLFAQAFIMPLPSPRWLPWALALWCAFEALMGLGCAATVHFAAEAMGARASGAGLFTLMALSQLVWVLAVPAALLLEAARIQGPGRLLVFLLLGALSFLYKLRAVQGHYGLSRGRAAAALLAPFALLAAAALVCSIVGVWALGGAVSALAS